MNKNKHINNSVTFNQQRSLEGDEKICYIWDSSVCTHETFTPTFPREGWEGKSQAGVKSSPRTRTYCNDVVGRLTKKLILPVSAFRSNYLKTDCACHLENVAYLLSYLVQSWRNNYWVSIVWNTPVNRVWNVDVVLSFWEAVYVQ